MTDLQKRESSRMRAYNFSQYVEFAIAVVVLVLGALTLAFGIVKYVAGVSILFGDTDPAFQVLVGFVVVITGSFLIPDGFKSSGYRGGL